MMMYEIQKERGERERVDKVMCIVKDVENWDRERREQERNDTKMGRKHK